MATYNGEKYIEEQLLSILKQLCSEDELIISDDSSTDCTVNIIKSSNDKRIRLFENCHFRNPIYNFENALKHASGDIIVLSDQDDVWLDNKIKIIKKHFSTKNYKKNVCTLVMDNYSIDAAGNIIDQSLYQYLNSGNGIIKNFIRNTYLGCNMAFSKKLIEVALPFPSKIPMHDVWLGLISEIYGEVCFSPEKTMLFRRHGNNATKERYSMLQVLKWRYYLAQSLIIKIKNMLYFKLRNVN